VTTLAWEEGRDFQAAGGGYSHEKLSEISQQQKERKDKKVNAVQDRGEKRRTYVPGRLT